MSFKNRYGLFERMLHHVAFGTRFTQAALADMEDRLYRRELQLVQPASPVLITALPRAGTTILLELLAGAPSFASHTYRDMPFILCPMIWQRLSKRFQKPADPHERAHQDGILISPDSPEAFEEVVWMRFWRRHYGAHAIDPWDRCDEAEFVEFLTSHMRKIIALRAREKPTARRYVSKNNLNVARIPALWGALPTAIVVVLFREPLQHAASLLRQHRQFSALHAEDTFARRYMAAIGHFDFGSNLKPVNFGGWLDRLDAPDPDRIQFWVDYWLATYQHVLHHVKRERLVLIRYEALGPEADLAPLAAALELEDADELRARQHILGSPRSHVVDPSDLSIESVQAARDLYAQLMRHSLV